METPLIPHETPDPTVMAQLAAHAALTGAPASEHAWLARRGELRTWPAGFRIAVKGQRIEELFVIFSGRVVVRVDHGLGPQKILEIGGGGLSGRLPFSRMTSSPGDVVTEEATDGLAIDERWLPEMVRECPVSVGRMVHAMLDRARTFKIGDLQQEKLVSLGKLAAGLAHELNNPASAAARSAKRLQEGLRGAEEAAMAVGAARLTDAQWAAIGRVRAHCAEAPPPLTSLERADREDALATWLAAHGADERCAAPLAETAITVAALDEIAAAVPAAALNPALRWISAGCTVRATSSEIEMAASRIYDLVNSVKGFTFMDHAPTTEPVDIRRGIHDTLTMLGGKTRAKGVELAVRFADDLPRALAVGAELNQVWMNLIDNALDAVPAGGHVTVTARRDGECVLVHVEDDGPGIPPAALGRIFDPFFTTKEVGKGTGLGLDIVRRIVQRHEGSVNVASEPGKTRFEVLLPAAP
ncbi:MAG: GHKL domain-containing protein [Gemmatimonadetes bacterium]|nr:GHKL domain-containing protein [Gemmatimonadota bacterium]